MIKSLPPNPPEKSLLADQRLLGADASAPPHEVEPPPLRPIIDAPTAAGLLGVSVSMVYKLLRDERLEGYSIGRRKVVYADSVQTFRQRHAIGGAVQAVQKLAPHTPRRKKVVKPLVLPASRHLR